MSGQDHTGYNKDISICAMTEDDTGAVAAMEESIFTMPWKLKDFRELLDKPDRGCVVAKAGDVIVGCVVYHNIVGDVDITNVQVKEGYRGRGIGKRLMKAAMEKARATGGERFTLEVRESNLTAISLYESLGFTLEGKRKNFYENPREDAVIMWKKTDLMKDTCKQ